MVGIVALMAILQEQSRSLSNGGRVCSTVAEAAAADTIHDSTRIAGNRGSAPRDVPVRSHQDKGAFVKRSDRRVSDGLDAQRQTASFGGVDQWIAAARFRAQPHEHKALAVEVDGRAAVRKPRMRRAAAGTSGRQKAWRLGVQCRAAIRYADRRTLVAILQLEMFR